MKYNGQPRTLTVLVYIYIYKRWISKCLRHKHPSTQQFPGSENRTAQHGFSSSWFPGSRQVISSMSQDVVGLLNGNYHFQRWTEWALTHTPGLFWVNVSILKPRCSEGVWCERCQVPVVQLQLSRSYLIIMHILMVSFLPLTSTAANFAFPFSLSEFLNLGKLSTALCCPAAPTTYITLCSSQRLS